MSSVSGLSRALWAEAWNAQFLEKKVSNELGKDNKWFSYFKLEATPPLRIVSLCSVKTTSLAKGYSTSSVSLKISAGRGVTKKDRPVGVWEESDISKSACIESSYWSDIPRSNSQRHLKENVILPFASSMKDHLTDRLGRRLQMRWSAEEVPIRRVLRLSGRV